MLLAIHRKVSKDYEQEKVGVLRVYHSEIKKKPFHME